MKLGLGTAQLGMDYGLTNRVGKPSHAAALALLRRAFDRGIDLVDTAAAYGNAESMVGEAIRAGCGFRVVTKIAALPDGAEPRAALRAALRTASERLATASLHGVLLHRSRDALGARGTALIAALREAREEGLAQRIGVSVYRAEDIDEVLRQFTPDIVQLPLNALDQRLLNSRHLERLRDLGVEVHARSVFLQGALLSPQAELPPFLQPLRPALDRFRALAGRHSLSSAEAALAFVLQTPDVAAMVIGVTSVAELDQLADAYRAAQQAPRLDFSEVAHDVRSQLLDPDRWPKMPEASWRH